MLLFFAKHCILRKPHILFFIGNHNCGLRKPNLRKECKNMSNNSSNRLVVPAAREAMEKFKMESANEVGVNLKNGYNGDITARQAGSIGGQMVKKMIEAYENGLK